jgi:hypothetical protein
MMIFTRSSSKSREAYHSIEKKESVTTIAARAIMVEVLVIVVDSSIYRRQTSARAEHEPIPNFRNTSVLRIICDKMGVVLRLEAFLFFVTITITHSVTRNIISTVSKGTTVVD